MLKRKVNYHPLNKISSVFLLFSKRENLTCFINLEKMVTMKEKRNIIFINNTLHRVRGYTIMNSRRGNEMDPEFENEMISEDSCCSHPHGRMSHHSEKTKKNLVTRLNRIEGQIRGIKRLIENDTYCDDVITQIAASQAALK